MTFHFVATCTPTLDLDPAEFRDLTVPEIVIVIVDLLGQEYPDANPFHDDIVSAAHELHTAATAG